MVMKREARATAPTAPGYGRTVEEFDVSDAIAEEWRPVVGYEGRYEVSSLGRVKSLPRCVGRKDGSGQFLKGRLMVLTPHASKSPYPTVALCKNGVQRQHTVHRLVLEAFVGPCPPGMEACHNDGNHADSSLANLRWDTHLENHRDSVEHGTAYVTPQATHCKRGHERTPDNVYVYWSAANNKMVRLCRQCSRDRYQRERQRDRKPPPTHCKRGHEYTPENTRLSKNRRGRVCRACKNEREREQRAAARRLR